MSRTWQMALVIAWVEGVGLSASMAASVVITGGADASEHNYTWTVTNNYHSRLVYIEFPQYAADLFMAPDQWGQEFINRCHIGWKDEVGKCIARTAKGYAGLPQGASAEFAMRIAARGALVGQGSVLVKFEDGTTATIPGVQLPTKQDRGTPYLALIGTGIIFVGFIIYNERRRKKKSGAEPVEEQT